MTSCNWSDHDGFCYEHKNYHCRPDMPMREVSRTAVVCSARCKRKATHLINLVSLDHNNDGTLFNAYCNGCVFPRSEFSGKGEQWRAIRPGMIFYLIVGGPCVNSVKMIYRVRPQTAPDG